MARKEATRPPVKSSEGVERRPAVSNAKSRRSILAEKKFCRTEKSNEGSELEQNAPFAGGDLGSLDLFGNPPENHSEKLQKQPEIRENACSRCNAPFSQASRRGRPLRFCSDTCRRASKADQTREWGRVHARKPAASLITCRTCQREFEPPPRSTGRAPHWCSHRCKLAAFRKPGDRPAMPDLFTKTERITDHD